MICDDFLFTQFIDHVVVYSQLHSSILRKSGNIEIFNLSFRYQLLQKYYAGSSKVTLFSYLDLLFLSMLEA